MAEQLTGREVGSRAVLVALKEKRETSHQWQNNGGDGDRHVIYIVPNFAETCPFSLIFFFYLIRTILTQTIPIFPVTPTTTQVFPLILKFIYKCSFST